MLQGKAKWAKLVRPNKYGKWSLDLYMDQDNIDKFKSMGVKNHLKKDEEGYYVSFGRPTSRVVRGQIIAMPPPILLDKDNVPTVMDNVGNGSDVTVKIEHYSYTNPLNKTKEHACRIHAVRIDNLVPFSIDDDLKDTDPDKQVAKQFETKGIAF